MMRSPLKERNINCSYETHKCVDRSRSLAMEISFEDGANKYKSAVGAAINLQDAFLKFRRQRQKEMQQAKEMQKTMESRSNPLQMLELRQKFVTQAKKYFGVPYAKRYHDPGTPFYDSPLFLDCCGLVRQVLRDLEEDFGLMIGSWNQAYMYDVLPIAIDKEEDMKPGDLVFISGTYYNPKSKAQIHDIVHVEIWLGEEEKTIGARWQKGVVQVHDSYKFEAKSYHSMKYHFRSIDTWLTGICKSYCTQHGWRKSQFIPGNRSVFALFLEDVFSQDQAAEAEEETAENEEETVNREKEILNHEEEIVNHEGEIVDHEGEIVNHEGEIVNHEGEIMKHDGEIVHHEDEILNHEEEIGNHEEEIVHHEGEIVNHEGEIVNHEGEIVNHEGEIVNHEGETVNHEGEIYEDDMNHEGEILDRKEEIMNHEDDIMNHEGEILDREEKTVDHREEIVNHNQPAEEDEEIMDHEQDIVDHKEVIMEEETVNHKGEIMSHEGEIMNNDEEIVNHEGEIVNHEGEIVDHEGEIVNHEGEIVNHERKIMHQEGEIVDREEGEIVNREDETVTLEEKTVNQEDEIVNQEDEIVNHEDEVMTEESSNMKGTVNLNINSTDETYTGIPGDDIHAVAKFGSDTCNEIEMQDTIVEESGVGVVDAGAPTKGDIPSSELHCVEPVSSTMHSASSCFKVIDCMQYYRNEWWASVVRCPNDNNSKRKEASNAASPCKASGERRGFCNSPGRPSRNGQNNDGGKKRDRSPGHARVRTQTRSSSTHQPTFFLGGANGNWMIEETLLSLGWKRVENKYDESVSLKWVECKNQINYNTFREGAQLVNHISNIGLLTTKMGLLSNLQEHDRILQKTCAKTRLPLSDFVPETYGLTNSAEKKTFVHEIYKEGEVWICKPTGLNQGKGIYLINNKQQLMNKLGINTASQQVSTRRRNISRPPQGRIIQRYIANPLLLNGCKFDVRAYMLIASTRPYIVLYHAGYVRLSCVPYTPYSDDGSQELHAHLTNQYVQKMHPLYSSLKEDTVWSYERLQAHIDKNLCQQELPENWVRNTFEKRMQQIMLVCFESVRQKLHRRMGYFDLLGFDFMIDDNFKVWLLEINVNPALHTNCHVLMERLPAVVHETLKLVIEIFEKSKKKRPVFPLQELHGFQLLYNGVGKR